MGIEYLGLGPSSWLLILAVGPFATSFAGLYLAAR